MTTLQAALADTILRCEVGSTAHGLAIDGQDDRDEMGVFLESPERVIGLRSSETVVSRDRPEGVRSQPGDLDLVLHPLRKWVRLALNGNPTILAMMFAPLVGEPHYIGRHLRDDGPKHLLSRRCLAAYLGYLTQQKQRLRGERGQKRTKRPELVERYGYDTKYAAHALRLGLQGVELAKTGRLELPMEQECLRLVRGVRQGEIDFLAALGLIGMAEASLAELYATGQHVLPDEPDRKWADNFLVQSHISGWSL